ncbi:hypothetical protein DV737_g4942, partial [Chaetothyriales sp. CBS 132003]
MPGFLSLEKDTSSDTASQKLPEYIDVAKYFDGQKHLDWNLWVRYLNPDSKHVEEGATRSRWYRHRDILGRITYRPKDVLRYVNPIDGKPYRLIVQATDEALSDPAVDWRRKRIQGNAPLVLRLSTWVLKEFFRRKPYYTTEDWAKVIGKILLVSPIQLILVNIPIGSGETILHRYPILPARSWDYPKYARNELLDARPNAPADVVWEKEVYNFSGQHSRLLRPRCLVIRRENQSFIESFDSESQGAGEPYLLVSYTREHFNPDDQNAGDWVYKIADHMTSEAGLTAYWVDHICLDQQPGPQQSDDIHRICDVIRGARQLIVALPDLQDETLQTWGQRMWTFPEALLCANKLIKFCEPSGQTITMSKIELANVAWKGDQVGRQLAEIYSGSLQVSALELISKCLEALSVRKTNERFAGDLAYALAGLLGQRPRANPFDNQFQALARLSLANDSSNIVERMMCMLPDYDYAAEQNQHNADTINALQAQYHNKFVLRDRLGAQLWDIEPLCQVAGVCEGSAVMLDGCRGASIRWQDIPQIAYLHKETWTRYFVGLWLRSGALWFVLGTSLASIHGPIKSGGVFFLALGVILTFTSPWAITILYGGKVWGATPWLIGFEGTLPIREIERISFGNAIGRLSYAPSSSLLQCKDTVERIGAGPVWIERNGPKPPLPPNHRLFTLIDTGTMTVTVFSCEKPPSVALIVGREGGMLRVALCRYARESAMLVKETVIRCETPMLDYAGLLGWVKVA